VCERERERETDRAREREREREGGKKGGREREKTIILTGYTNKIYQTFCYCGKLGKMKSMGNMTNGEKNILPG
jgi:hypothetical protein